MCAHPRGARLRQARVVAHDPHKDADAASRRAVLLTSTLCGCARALQDYWAPTLSVLDFGRRLAGGALRAVTEARYIRSKLPAHRDRRRLPGL